jgi:hypothetical protein
MTVDLAAFQAERQHAWEDRETHIAVCRWHRQGLGCSLCYRVAERLDQAEARVRRAEERRSQAQPARLEVPADNGPDSGPRPTAAADSGGRS